MSGRSRQVLLASRPSGLPTAANFEVVEVDVPAPGPGEAEVENLYMSVDPYMRGRMADRRSYVPPFQVGQVLEGGAVGRVVESADSALRTGDHVVSMSGWRERFTAPAAQLQRITAGRIAPSAFLGALGMPGHTAWVGLNLIARARPGETVFVSAAAGAVGNVVCQLARFKGCTVLGSAGGATKVDLLLRELGVDAAFDYRTRPAMDALAELAPQGIDVYFDNVGGEQLDAALLHMRDFGRVAMCGAISIYNEEIPPPGPRFLGLAVPRRLMLRGFIVRDHADTMGDFHKEVRPMVESGRLRLVETVVEGIGRAPEAFISLFGGDHVGKLVVKLAD